MPRDFQRTATYRWGLALATWFPRLRRKHSLLRCEAYVHRVWADYRPDQRPPRVIEGTVHAHGDRLRIRLPKWARIPHIILHEVAHSLLRDSDTHGPAFVRLLLELLVRYESIPAREAEWLATHENYRLRLALPSFVPKPKTKGAS